MVPDGLLAIEVVYALPDCHVVVALTVSPGTSVRNAIAQSGLAARYPEVDGEKVRVGVYGRVVAGDTILRDGDRVEIYRPLVADPKQARRRRAARSA